MSFAAMFRAMFRGKSQYPLLPANGHFTPTMVQRPLIDAGNTGRYALDAFQVAFNSPVGGGTLCANGPGSKGVYLDVHAQKAGVYGGMGTIPQTLVTQGLMQGFRDGGL